MGAARWGGMGGLNDDEDEDAALEKVMELRGVDGSGRAE